MPAYKLMYFDTKGRAEVIRLAFAAAGQSFEDKRFPLSMEEWQAVKPTIPQKQLPCLQVDGRLIPQSGAIMRYVAREFGLYGDNNDDNTRVDVIIGTAEDFLKNAFALRYEKDETKRAELKKDLEENKLPQFFSLLEDILKENNGGDGFFVGEKISLADIMIYDITDQVGAAAKLPAFPPKLGGLIERVKNHPKIKEYLAKRGD
ncbi:S-crystallin SL11-like isoform X1 [Crassostrea angulata]|uniref:S-crystallin SL11-like isoform X1 n=1 Tax=Magallana angulata TaxID=2784310 RepID=UPI0022B0CA17|nr:S-crystallin SL11-like isoform X1 [Crassostrea angulata]